MPPVPVLADAGGTPGVRRRVFAAQMRLMHSPAHVPLEQVSSVTACMPLFQPSAKRSPLKARLETPAWCRSVAKAAHS